MTTEKRNRNWIRWLVIALVFIGPLLPFYIWDRQHDPLENALMTASKDFQMFEGDLLQEAENEWRDFDASTNGTKRRESGSYWFRVTLPDNRWRDPHMYISYLHRGDLYLEGQLIHSFHTHSHFNHYIEGYQPQLIPLPEGFAGQDLYIHTYFSDQWVYPGLIYIDDSLNLILEQVMNSSYRILMGFILLLVAVSSLIFYMSRRERSYLYFSLVAWISVYACVVLSWGLFSLIIPWAWLPYGYSASLFFGGYCFMRFFIEVFGNGVRNMNLRLSQALLILLVVNIMTAVFTPSFYLHGLQDLTNLVIAPIVFALITISSIIAYRQKRNEESFWLMAGFVTFAILSIYAFIQYDVIAFVKQYASPLLPFIQAFTRLLYQQDMHLHSILIIIFCMMMILLARIRNMYRKATKTAAELAVMSESLEQLVRERTSELEEANIHLRASIEETTQALAEIAVLEDRNRIAQDMHDHVGNDLTAALIQIEAAKMLTTKDTHLALEKLEAARDTVNQGLANVRKTVRMMKEDYESRDIVPILQKLIQETEKRTEVKVVYKPEPLPNLEYTWKKTLFHALQEGLTNGIRHGKATEFQFSLTADGQYVRFRLSNNGHPNENKPFGFGLRAMSERIGRLGGTVQIENDNGNGFMLAIDLPYPS